MTFSFLVYKNVEALLLLQNSWEQQYLVGYRLRNYKKEDGEGGCRGEGRI